MGETQNKDLLDGKAVLVTGGTGSFGKLFVKTILDQTRVQRVIVFSRDELKQFEMQQTFRDEERIRFFIGDVRDRDRLYRAFDRVNVVVHAAAGSVGCFLGGLLAQKRAPSIGLVSTDEKAEVARRAGYLHVINYRREDPVDQVRQITASAGADVVYDSVAGPGFARSFEMCRAGGTVVLFGRAAGDPPREVLEDAFLGGARNLGLRTYSLATILFSDPPSIRGAYATLFDGLASGTIFLPIETLPLERAADAHANIEGQRTVGKIVLLPSTS